MWESYNFSNVALVVFPPSVVNTLSQLYNINLWAMSDLWDPYYKLLGKRSAKEEYMTL